MVEPITEYLDFVDPNNRSMHAIIDNKSKRIHHMERLKHDTHVYNSEMIKAVTSNRPYPIPIRQNIELENEEIFVTLIGILKNQEKRIEYLESIAIEGK